MKRPTSEPPRGAVSLLARCLAVSLILAPGCKKTAEPDEIGAAPPPVTSAKPGACAGGGGVPKDPVSAASFPRIVGDYCVDPNGDTRTYGEEARASLDDVCTEQLDGECEVYKAYGLKRVVTLRYVDGRGSPGTVGVTYSRFASKENAFGFFSKRVIADGDPVRTTLTDLHAGATGALGSGVAYVFRGQHLLELSYTNEAESPDQMRESSKRVLPALAQAIGDAMPGDATLPPAVLALPTENRLPMGVAYAVGDVFGVPGIRGGAVGYYKDGDRRYRIVALLRPDEDAAGDILETLKKTAHATTLKELPFPAMAFSAERDESAPRTDWVAGRKGSRVFGVGDEDLVLGGGRSKDEEQKLKLTKEEKSARLKKIVAGS